MQGYVDMHAAALPDRKWRIVLCRVPIGDAVYGSSEPVFVRVCTNRVADETDLYNRKENNAPQAIFSATEMAAEARLAQHVVLNPEEAGDTTVLALKFAYGLSMVMVQLSSR